MADDKEKGTEGGGKGGVLQMVTLLLLVVLIGLVGFVAWKLMQMEQAPAQASAATEAPPEIPEAKDEEEAGPPIFLDLDDITVNLADADATRFLRAKIKLEVRGEAGKKKVEESLVKINDLVITVLSSKTFADIRTPHGKYALKEELVYRINRLLGGRPVKNLFFTDFVAQ